MRLNELQVRLRQFTDARDWEQFHTIRNLILALVGEVGELAESVQWLGEIDKDYFKDNPEKFESFKDEIADIFKKVKTVTSRPAWTGSVTRVPSDQPPVEVPVRTVEVVEVKKPTRRKKATSAD